MGGEIGGLETKTIQFLFCRLCRTRKKKFQPKNSSLDLRKYFNDGEETEMMGEQPPNVDTERG